VLRVFLIEGRLFPNKRRRNSYENTNDNRGDYGGIALRRHGGLGRIDAAARERLAEFEQHAAKDRVARPEYAVTQSNCAYGI
jgi:hypothetical protein